MKQDSKPYDLEERTFQFALSVRLFLRQHKWDPVSWSDVTQVLRSSGSVAANFVEANKSISLDDKLYRLRLLEKKLRSPASGYGSLRKQIPQLKNSPQYLENSLKNRVSL